jgi:glycerophosphoryl diester phosphodiesterase
MLIAFVCFGVAIPSYGQVAKLIAQLHMPADQKVMVAAHRGDWRNAPENSLQAYKLAIAMGVDIIEVDLDKTRDGVIVIMHDPTLDRTTTGKGKTADFTLAELKALHLRDGLHVPTQHTIPTLEEVMLLAKGKVLVNLDHSFPFYREAYDILVKTGTLQQAIFKADESYEQLKERYPDLIGKITYMPVTDIEDQTARAHVDTYLAGMHPVACEINFEHDTASIIQNPGFIKKGQARIWVNSLWPRLSGGHDDERAVVSGDTADTWGWLIDHGANIIQTDRPAALLNYLRKKHLHD